MGRIEFGIFAALFGICSLGSAQINIGESDVQTWGAGHARWYRKGLHHPRQFLVSDPLTGVPSNAVIDLTQGATWVFDDIIGSETLAFDFAQTSSAEQQRFHGATHLAYNIWSFLDHHEVAYSDSLGLAKGLELGETGLLLRSVGLSLSDDNVEVCKPPDTLLKLPLQLGLTWQSIAAYPDSMRIPKIGETSTQSDVISHGTVVLPGGASVEALLCRSISRTLEQQQEITLIAEYESLSWITQNLGVVARIVVARDPSGLAPGQSDLEFFVTDGKVDLQQIRNNVCLAFVQIPKSGSSERHGRASERVRWCVRPKKRHSYTVVTTTGRACTLGSPPFLAGASMLVFKRSEKGKNEVLEHSKYLINMSH